MREQPERKLTHQFFSSHGFALLLYTRRDIFTIRPVAKLSMRTTTERIELKNFSFNFLPVPNNVRPTKTLITFSVIGSKKKKKKNKNKMSAYTYQVNVVQSCLRFSFWHRVVTGRSLKRCKSSPDAPNPNSLSNFSCGNAARASDEA